jgi:hypothetical protein
MCTHAVGEREASGRYKALETTTQIPAASSGKCDRARLLHLSTPLGLKPLAIYHSLSPPKTPLGLVTPASLHRDPVP